MRDEPGRLDLFGGYEFDDEGTRPRSVKLLDAGRLAGRLTDRAHGGRGASTGHGRRGGPSDAPLPRGSNIVVSPGHATDEEMARRLGSGLWIEELAGGSVELSSGLFRLSFPRARRVRRGRLADEIGPGILSGEILAAVKSIETGIGRDVRPYRHARLVRPARTGRSGRRGGAGRPRPPSFRARQPMTRERLAELLEGRAPGAWELYEKTALSQEASAAGAERTGIERREEGWAARWWEEGVPRFAAASSADGLARAVADAASLARRGSGARLAGHEAAPLHRPGPLPSRRLGKPSKSSHDSWRPRRGATRS